MKAFKKHIFIFLFLIIGIFFVGVDEVKAANIKWHGVKIECIYTDGGAYSFSYMQIAEDEGVKTYEPNVNRITYNLVGVDTSKSGTTSSVQYVNFPVATPAQSSDHKCKQWLRSGTVTEEDDEGNDKTTSYYKFANEESDTIFTSDNFTNVGWWDWFWKGNKAYEEKAAEANANGDTFELVAERYILTESAGEPNYTLTYKEASEQATGSDNYAYIMVFGDTYLLKTREKTTLLETGVDHFNGISVNSKGEVSGIEDQDTIYINNPEPFSTTDTTGVASHYFKYNQVRYEISTSKGGVFDRKYVLFNTGLGKGEAPADELCESIMPETSKILRRIIQIMQFLIPVLMIVLCGIDIGKIVVSGNIEEDLPKQKKRIIARLIIGVLFFFLPLITTLVIDLLKDSGAVEAQDIKSIECLFE